MTITREMMQVLNSAFAKFETSEVKIGAAFQYDTAFVFNSAIGSMGGNEERIEVFFINESGVPEPTSIKVGHNHHSNYAYESGSKEDGETVREYFKNTFPEFLLVRSVGYSNWGDGLHEWDTVTIMPCGFYNPKLAYNEN